jgi:hypothetical protein
LEWSAGGESRELPNYGTYVGDCEWHSIILNWGSDTISLSVDGSAVTAASGGPSGQPFMTPDLSSTVLVGTPRRYITSNSSYVNVVSSPAFFGCLANLVRTAVKRSLTSTFESDHLHTNLKYPDELLPV